MKGPNEHLKEIADPNETGTEPPLFAEMNRRERRAHNAEMRRRPERAQGPLHATPAKICSAPCTILCPACGLQCDGSGDHAHYHEGECIRKSGVTYGTTTAPLYATPKADDPPCARCGSTIARPDTDDCKHVVCANGHAVPAPASAPTAQ